MTRRATADARSPPAGLLRGDAADVPEALRRRRRPAPQPPGRLPVGGVPRRRGLLRPVGAALPRPDHRPRAQAAGRRLHRPGGHPRPGAPGPQRPPRRARLPHQAVRAAHQEGPRPARPSWRRPSANLAPPPRSSTSPPRWPSSCSPTPGGPRPVRRRRVRNLFLWHALEESEHKAVAFDVYKAVGGTERMRTLTMDFMRFGFVAGMSVQILISRARRPRHLPAGRAPRAAGGTSAARRSSPRRLWRQLRDYNRPDFHPDDRETAALIETVADRAVRRRRLAHGPPRPARRPEVAHRSTSTS